MAGWNEKNAMHRAYHQKWFHIKGLPLPGLIFAMIPVVYAGVSIFTR